MKIAIFTRTGCHHTSFINRIQEACDISCVVRESYPKVRFDAGNHKTKNNNSFLNEFHKEYSAGFTFHPKVKNYLTAPFDAVIKKQGVTYLEVACGDLNNKLFVEFLKDLQPDIVVVLGSSVIREHIISIPNTAMINLHSGISPYYRGTWSYGWPIVNGEPEYIGATIHHVSPGIDSGDIICQTRPVLADNDDLNDIFLKIIAEGTELMVWTVKDILTTGSCVSYKQPRNTGKLYTTGDLNADSARKCLENLRNGVIKEYNSEKERRDSNIKLFGYVPPALYT
jgi:folate-dependent phosphoribosylglycinamide formyltransferase PurN